MPPPFLYGTHYSTPGYVLYFLVRKVPEYMLCLQSGKFDTPDRLFRSIKVTWDGCVTNHTDVKELIPEFFDCKLPADEWLQNGKHLDLGTTQKFDRVDDVELRRGHMTMQLSLSGRTGLRLRATTFQTIYIIGLT